MNLSHYTITVIVIGFIITVIICNGKGCESHIIFNRNVSKQQK